MPYFRCGDLNSRGGYIAGISSHDRVYTQANKKYVEVNGTPSNMPSDATGRLRLKPLRSFSFLFFAMHLSDTHPRVGLRINGVDASPNFPVITKVQYGVVPIGFYSVTPDDIIDCWITAHGSCHLVAAAVQNNDNIVSV